MIEKDYSEEIRGGSCSLDDCGRCSVNDTTARVRVTQSLSTAFPDYTIACLEKKPYFLRAKLLRNWLVIEANLQTFTDSTTRDREQDNGRSLQAGYTSAIATHFRGVTNTRHVCRGQGAIILRFSFSSALQLQPPQNQAESITGKELPVATLFV